jgi:hypothetical protein
LVAVPEFVAAIVWLLLASSTGAQPPQQTGDTANPSSLDEAQLLFYNGRYEDAEVLTLRLCTTDLDALAACELRSSTLLFQIKRAVGTKGGDAAWKACARCPELLTAFRATTAQSQAMARARLKAVPTDEATRFLLGKIDLNYVWLQLGVLGHKTGWSEYWEARHSLDMALEQNPDDIRARVARAWIDYIVDTRMPRTTRWILGGGNKNRGLRVVADAASREQPRFVHAEAAFALWDMQNREGLGADAAVTARELARDYPANEELRKFLALREVASH